MLKGLEIHGYKGWRKGDKYECFMEASGFAAQIHLTSEE